MKERTHQTTMNDEGRPQAEALIDLPVTDEQADRTTAGGAPAGRLYLATETGVFV